MTNDEFKKALPGTQLKYFDAEAAIEQLAPGAYAALPYTAKVLLRTSLGAATQNHWRQASAKSFTASES